MMDMVSDGEPDFNLDPQHKLLNSLKKWLFEHYVTVSNIILNYL